MEEEDDDNDVEWDWHFTWHHSYITYWFNRNWHLGIGYDLSQVLLGFSLTPRLGWYVVYLVLFNISIHTPPSKIGRGFY